ncbi:rhodanese-like domain-containing protein [Corynebacterium epidermidicanis]|uniref:Rhodanese-related sulfurtransferase n=1 Tax=Corynebacterium epidermidicanis TaxID=1050174 RepID=A0A0G3GS24_9CORY|nr:rhodanese-like domain-containing protein [Corynebacterium epidermidicanis]AKK03996.1 Rhodanese-related sulfurtransferase [Corynebacterium epidermidicanis]
MKSIAVTEVPKDAQLVDVREVAEWDEIHAKGSVNYPMSEFTLHTGKLDRSRPVYVICKSGGRSAQVAEYLNEAGIEAINVEGGTTAWVDAGLPTE